MVFCFLNFFCITHILRNLKDAIELFLISLFFKVYKIMLLKFYDVIEVISMLLKHHKIIRRYWVFERRYKKEVVRNKCILSWHQTITLLCQWPPYHVRVNAHYLIKVFRTKLEKKFKSYIHDQYEYAHLWNSI